MANTKKVLFIGGHGKVGLLTTPKLHQGGHGVTSMIRNPDQVSDIEATGATALILNVTDLNAKDWADLAAEYDVVVWSAGSGGTGGDDATYAVDRDAALACVDGLKQLEDDGEKSPRFIMVSYLGSLENQWSEGDSMYAYGEAKKAVDTYLLDSNLEYVILAPAVLTLDRAQGVTVVEGRPEAADGGTTSRHLVADVIVEMAGRDTLPEGKIIQFVDGDTPVTGI